MLFSSKKTFSFSDRIMGISSRKCFCSFSAIGLKEKAVIAPESTPPKMGIALPTPFPNVSLVILKPIHLATCLMTG